MMISRAMGAIKPGSQGERAISVKTIAQGRPGCLGQTCGNCRLLFFLQAGHGRGERPAFPAPSVSKEGALHASTRVKRTARTRRHVTRPARIRTAQKSNFTCLYYGTVNTMALHDDRTAEALARFQYYLRLLLDDSDLEASGTESSIRPVSRYRSQRGQICDARGCFRKLHVFTLDFWPRCSRHSIDD